MTFQTFPINITGPSAEHRDSSLSSQFTQNFYPEMMRGGKTDFTTQSFPGQSLFGSAFGSDRGSWEMQNIGYRVVETTLFEVSSSGAHVSRGTIPGDKRCTFADDGSNLIICCAGVVQQYTQSTNILITVTDVNIVGSTAVDFLNNKFFYTNVNIAAGVDFVVSNVGDGTTASGLNAGKVEDDPGKLVRAYSFEDRMYMFTERTTPLYWNNGDVQPPLVPVEGRVIEKIGLDALHSVAHTDKYIYWLGDDKMVYRAISGQAQPISTIPIAHSMESYAVTSDAVGYTFSIEGQNFYVLSFPTENKTWCLNEALGPDGWFNLSSDTNRGKYNATSHMFVYNKHLLSDETNGNLYALDINAYTNNTLTIQRVRTMASIHGGLVGFPGKLIQMSSFELIMKKGVGLITGQGDNPQIIIEYSIDGGESFKQGKFVKVGRRGQTNIKVKWDNLSTFYDLIIRITTSDPVYYSLQTASIDARLAGY
tara:strand:+ start:387 stop:1823 length:1437 start_codon:yes stop_codon:yes gene_type:complete